MSEFFEDWQIDEMRLSRCAGCRHLGDSDYPSCPILNAVIGGGSHVAIRPPPVTESGPDV